MPEPTVFLVVGTRPEAIKVAPVALELRRFPAVRTVLVSTGQHREILHSALAAFDLTPDLDLDIMTAGQTLAQVTARAVEGLDRLIAEEKPDLILGQGDTTTTFAAALASFYRRVPFGHIEAGLRTATVDDPFPEEFNRRAATLVTRMHFAPTTWSRDNLLRERVEPASVLVTGNTGIDAVLLAAEKLAETPYADHPGRVLLLTTHRRENWGEPQRRIARAARRLLDRFLDLLLIAPMHPNPVVRESLVPILGDHTRARLIEPLDYAGFVPVMRRADLILSDSGGVQEEAPAFGRPVLVLRETTERPEGCDAGTARLVGTDEETIFAAASELLADPDAYRAMANAVSPYGDGRASARIRHAVLTHLGVDSPEEVAWTS